MLPVHAGPFTYDWIDHWCRIPATPSGRANGRTHGIAWLASRGRFVVFHQADPAVLVVRPDGTVESAWGDRFAGAHGLAVAREGGEEFLWLVDQKSGEILQTDPEGRLVRSLPRPPHPWYGDPAAGDRGGQYTPTWAAQNPANGDVWVADGYGSWLLHRFDAAGRHVQSLDGTAATGRFAEPHGIAFTPADAPTGSGGPELWITDRAHHRILVLDGEGRFLRATTAVHSPCAFDFQGDLALVPQLFGSVTLLDRHSLAVVGTLGANPDVAPNPSGAWWPPVAPAGWPNLAGTPELVPGRFNSPHGACFGPDGSLYVAEWIVGGRLTRLARRHG